MGLLLPTMLDSLLGHLGNMGYEGYAYILSLNYRH